MASFVKLKLKSAREALGKKDYAKARDLAHGVLEYEPENYHGYVRTSNIERSISFCFSNAFLGLAFFNLKENEQSEQVTAALRLALVH